MHALAVLCLAAVALAKPQDYYTPGHNEPAVTTVTERNFVVKGNADKYYGANYGSYLNGYGYSGYAAAPAQTYYHHAVAAAPAVHYHQPSVAVHATAAPAVAYHATAAPAVAYHATAAPAVAYHATAAPAVAYHAPAVVHHAVQHAPVYQQAYSAVTAAPAVAYATAAPAVAVHNANYYAPSVAVRTEGIQYNDAYLQAEGPTKVFKHVYAFAAPEEPATRAHVSVQAPVNKRKHYKLIFIKAPSHQTVVDSDITLPAQEEEKTLIYVLSKNQKQIQPEIRIKQAEASKHAKPDVFFLKYRNEAEAQAIASGAISGQDSGVPANGEIISDGSVSLLGQSNVYDEAAYRNNVLYRSGFKAPAAIAPALTPAIAGINQYSVGTVGIIPTAAPVAAVAPANPTVVIGNGVHSFNHADHAVNIGADAAFRATSFAAPVPVDQEVNLKVTTEPTTSYEGITSSTNQA